MFCRSIFKSSSRIEPCRFEFHSDSSPSQNFPSFFRQNRFADRSEFCIEFPQPGRRVQRIICPTFPRLNSMRGGGTAQSGAKVFEKWNIKRIISLSSSNTINTSIHSPGKGKYFQGLFEKRIHRENIAPDLSISNLVITLFNRDPRREST